MRHINREDLENNVYYQTPKWLFDLLLEGKITPGAYATYILMYDRVRLSSVNGWFDTNGKVYIKYSYEELLKDLRIKSNTQIQRNLSKLMELDLIDKKKNFSSSTTYYLKIYSPTQNVVVIPTQSVSIIPTQNVETNKNNLNKNNTNNNNDVVISSEQIEYAKKIAAHKEKMSFKIREKNYKLTPEDMLKWAGGDYELVERQFEYFGDKGVAYLRKSIQDKYEIPKSFEKEKNKDNLLKGLV